MSSHPGKRCLSSFWDHKKSVKNITGHFIKCISMFSISTIMDVRAESLDSILVFYITPSYITWEKIRFLMIRADRTHRLNETLALQCVFMIMVVELYCFYPYGWSVNIELHLRQPSSSISFSVSWTYNLQFIFLCRMKSWWFIHA
jgi:hypothetical protein